MKDIKIRINSEEHSKKVQDCLFSLGYSWLKDKKEYRENKPFLFVYNKNNRISYDFNENYFNQHDNIEVELVTEVSDGKVYTYLKEVTLPKKKFGFEVRKGCFANSNNYLVAINEKNEIIAFLINLQNMTFVFGVKSTIEAAGYDTSDYAWDNCGSIKIN